MSFIHFGCWNNGICNINKNNNGMSLVFKELINNTYNPDFYVIAGDNYYPEKRSEGGKIFNKENFYSGFNCVRKLNEYKPVYMLMGNHDLQYENNLYDTENKKIDKCSIIEKENLNSKNLNFGRYAKMLNKYTICIFINSSFYTDDKDIILDCFKKFKTKYKYTNSIEEVISHEENILKKILILLKGKFKIKNVILIGHDPILYRKEKPPKEANGDKPAKKGYSVRRPLNIRGLKFIDEIYSIIPNVNKYYLCADIHQFQKGIINLGKNKIIQYVSGTGGAEWDKICSQLNESPEKIEIEGIELDFQLVECLNSFGFLHCISDKQNITFNFIKVEKSENIEIKDIERFKKKYYQTKKRRNSLNYRFGHIERNGGKHTHKFKI